MRLMFALPPLPFRRPRLGESPSPDDAMFTRAAKPARNLTFEREWTATTAHGMGTTADLLTIFAEGRAGDLPVRELATRDFPREIREELADARNYCAWAAEQAYLADEPDPAMLAAAAECSQAVTAAFAAAIRMRDLRAGR